MGLWAAIRRRLSWPRVARSLGESGERMAARYLRRQGLRVVARGVRERFGELDLVAVDGRTVVFVEVKTRRSADILDAVEAVDLLKQRRITRAALAFLRRNGLLEERWRFDIVAICWPSGGQQPVIRHFPDAFPASGVSSMFS
jgi:putative endonuclease